MVYNLVTFPLKGLDVGKAFQVGPWLVQPSLNTVSQNGKTCRLEPKVMEVLVCLAEHSEETVSKEKLLQTVWPETFVTDDVLIRSISELRRVFEDGARESRVIQTIPKRGYRLVAPVTPVNGVSGARPAQPALPEPAKMEGATQATPARRYRLVASLVGILAAASVAFAMNLGGVRSRLLLKADPAAVRSLAVLPLVNLSNDPNQEYFADGVTDALITDLAQIASLRVISRTSIMHYKNTRKTLPEIARELNVDEIVEGTVQRSGDRVRITAQLVHGATDTHLWARSYERDLRDVLTLEGEAAKSVADEIQARLTPQEKARLVQDRTISLQGLEAFLQGEHHASNYGSGYDVGELKKAAEYFQQSINDDPSFASAYIKLAETIDRESEMSFPADVYPREKAVAEKALALDPNLSDAHAALARVAFYYNWDWAKAEEEVRKALELNPSNAGAHEMLGDYFDSMGRMSEGLQEQQHAQQLDPDSDRLSNGFYRTRQYDRGIEWLRKQIDLNPSAGGHYIALMDFFAEKGMQAEHIDTMAHALVLYGFPKVAEALRRDYAAGGYRIAVRRLSIEAEKLYEQRRVVSAGLIAEDYARAGDDEKVFHWLEIAFQQRDGWLPFLACDPEWDPIRSDPRFKDIVRRVGLPQ